MKSQAKNYSANYQHHYKILVFIYKLNVCKLNNLNSITGHCYIETNIVMYWYIPIILSNYGTSNQTINSDPCLIFLHTMLF